MAEVIPDLAVYKVLRRTEWDDLQRDGTFEGSGEDRRDGFIHFSRANQVRGTLDRHFGGEGEVVLAEVATQGLIDFMRWEASGSGAELFPHLYGAFATDDVRRHWNLQSTNGEWHVPELAGEIT